MMPNENNCNGHFEEDEEMSSYRKDSNSVVTFNIVYDLNDIGRDKVLQFKPVMSHQIFGENESIFGYRTVSITLCYIHNSARCYAKVTSSGEIQSDVHKPDNILEALNPWLPENFVTDEKQFKNMFNTEKHNLIFGNVIFEFIDKQKCELFPDEEVYSTYKITHCNLQDDDFKSFHSRFETFVIWYIDGANFIDLDDEKWEIFYVYEEIKHPKTQQTYVTPIGYCTAYKFFAYPQNIRSRISQFFILPSHQKRGIGTILYETIFKVFQSQSEVIDITVEEPTSTFQRIRDAHDCVLVRKSLKKNNLGILKSPSKKIKNIMRSLKIGKKQSQRVYDILCGYDALISAEVYDEYLNNLKKRIESKVKEKVKGVKRKHDTRGIGVTDVSDENNMVETEYKRYKEDLEASIDNVKKTLQFCS